ncbi:unnamed protein product [Bursaphelenchus xylophilus]|uniref:Carboxylic ester hydrolase n=1 Tax=Bursaphelenchus xylophilus TaxID=6326 RepID=A0A1I7RUI4_BURXY|nr:unnamed protein product [Bursaphelenchus xylophilus]CAG9114150.1 unnamed protein product [Bursaphelenchus xylophilus]
MGHINSYLRPVERALPTKVLKTHNGAIQGLVYVFEDGRQASAYMSIPFAQPPIGELRFQKPQPPLPWEGIRDCTKLPPRCPHSDMIHEKVFIRIPKSEDCLYLNVFTPGRVEELREKLPVMVFVHGGGYTIHSCTHYGDSNICKCLCVKNVIVVTFNYRTGLLGFLCTGDHHSPGNYGFWDMHKALEWVRDNIETFGGDPNNVTIFGQSAGGSAVDCLALSPHTQGLFHRYIAMAGNAYATFSRQHAKRMREEWLYFATTMNGFKYDEKATDEEINEQLVKFLRALPASKLELSLLPSRKLRINKDGRIHVCPVVDGDFFPKEFLELRKEMPKKQVITGVTKWESLLFVIAKQINHSLKDFATMVLDQTLSKYKLDQPKQELIDKAFATFLDETKSPKSLEYKEQIIKLCSDVMFNNSTIHLAESMVKLGHDVYLYTFDYHRPSVGGLLGHLFPFKGATHSTELAYLFGKCIVSTHFTPSAEDLIVMDHFTNLFANFARYGDPNGRGEKKWIPISPDNVTRNYVIDLEECVMKPEFCENRYLKWAEIWPDLNEMPTIEEGEEFETIDAPVSDIEAIEQELVQDDKAFRNGDAKKN